MASQIFGGLTLKELMLRTWREANDDEVFGRAAELGYYFLLALFPMLIFLTSIVGFMPDIQVNIMNAVARFAPPEAISLIQETLIDVVENRSGGLLSFGVLGTIWAASTGVTAVIEALNAAYEAKEGRPYWKQRLVAIELTVALSVLIVGGTMMIMFGDRLIGWIAPRVGLPSSITLAWQIVDYLLGLALLLIGIELIYYYGPNVEKRWRFITPGGVFAALAFISVSILFSLYLRFAPSYSATYGSLGAVIVLMLWLYLMGLVLLVGAEINSEIRAAMGKPTIEREMPEQIKAA